MKLVKVTDPTELCEHIPGSSRRIVNYLNEVLATDPEAVTKLIDHAVPVNARLVEEGFPYSVEGEVQMLSGLGLIAGFTNTDKYRIYAEFENDNPPYGKITHFGWFRVEEDLSEEDLSEEDRAELRRRSEKIEQGKVTPIPRDEAEKRLRGLGLLT